MPGDQEQTYYLQEALQKKAMKATWDSEGKFEEDVDMAMFISWLMKTHVRHFRNSL